MLQIPEVSNPKLDQGSWVEYMGAKLLIAHAGNDAFLRRMQALQKPYKRLIERGELDPADQRKILTQAMGEKVLLGWEGVSKPYSVQTSVEWLRNDAELREFVMEYSSNLQNFRESEAEFEGNS